MAMQQTSPSDSSTRRHSRHSRSYRGTALAGAAMVVAATWAILTPPPAGAASPSTVRPAVTTSWGTPVILSDGQLQGEFAGISCPSPGNCTAVGEAGTDPVQPATATETNGAWGPVVLRSVGDGPIDRPATRAGQQALPSSGPAGVLVGPTGYGSSARSGHRESPHSPLGGDLYAVDCPSVGNCTAVGTGGESQPLVLTETDGTWGPVTLFTAGTSAGVLFGVSCTSAANCTAVGTGGSGPGQPIAVTETAGHWGPVVIFPVGNTYAALAGVSCTAPGNCTATGYNEYHTLVYQPLTATEVDGVWGPVTTLSSPESSAALVGVSCTSVGNCTSVGFVDNLEVATPAFAVERSGTWSAETAFGDSTGAGVLWGISCISQADCTATGTTGVEGEMDDPHAIAVTEVGGRWGAVVHPTSASAVILGVSCTSPGNCTTAGYPGADPLYPIVISLRTVPSGYRLVAADGGVFSYGSATFEGSHGGSPLHAPIVGMAATPDGKGYWLVAADGGVFAYGDAAFEGSHGNSPLHRPVVGMAATPDGNGYWLVAADGGVFAYGDAPFYGSHGGSPLNQPIVGMARTPDGGGYWLVAGDGGVFSYGDAAFEGSHAGAPLTKPIVGMVAAPGSGYWLVAADGGVFAYGSAVFEGSHGGAPLNQPVVGMDATPDGGGYWLVARDGGVFAYGDAPFFGSHGGVALTKPVVGLSGA